MAQTAQNHPSDVPSDQPGHMLASLTLERTVIHLGQFSTRGSNDRIYALGFTAPAGDSARAGRGAREIQWHAIGPLDAGGVQVDRLLAAGLAVVALNYVRSSGVQIGDAVLVLGDTPWSLLLLQWARLQGASPLVFACKGSTSLADMAASTGAELVIADATSRDLAKAAKATPRAAGFAVALDGMVTEHSLALALPALRDGGRYVFAALEPAAYAHFNAYPDLHRRDIEMVSPIAMPATIDLTEMLRFGLRLVEQGRLRLDALLQSSPDWPVRITSSGA